MVIPAEGWWELAIGVLGAVIGWITRHLTGNRNS